jgi:hypothetical protein
MRFRWLVVVLTLIAACGSARPILYSDQTLTEGKTYDYRVPVGGCAAPTVVVNDRKWEPDEPWILPLPKGWKVTTEGSDSHKTSYLDAAVRIEGDHLIISLPSGSVVNRYHTTNKRQEVCV